MHVTVHRALDKIPDYLHNAVDIMLGELEYVLITAAAGLGDSAYGAAIREEIEKVAGRTCSIGALYTTIERLEMKGMLKTWMGEATAQRGGRAKRIVRVTPKGIHAAKEFYEAMMRVSRNALWATGMPERAS
jgi:PadR family transcriptional regulator, regulatory protein PadR